MKKKKIIITFVGLCVFCAAMLVGIRTITASGSDYDYKDAQHEMIEEAKIIAGQPNMFHKKTTIGEVEGIPFYAEELELIAARLMSMNESEPYKQAFQKLKEYKHIEKLATKYGIVVSASEISAYNNEQKSLLNASTDDEVKKFMTDYYAAMEMSEDEYWNTIKSVESRRLLLRDKVETYMKSKSIKDIAKADIKYSISDKTYKKKIDGN